VSDLEAGRAAGLRTVLVLTGHGRSARKDAEERGLADAVAGDVASAASWIASVREREG